MNAFRPTSKDIELVSPPPDSISKIAFSPVQDILAVASWDNNVRLYNVNAQGQSEPKSMYAHEGPVLDLSWSKSGQQLFSSGCDNAARMHDLTTGQTTQVAAHDAPIKCVEYVDMPNGSGGTGILATAGWDKKLKYWDLRAQAPVITVDLTDRAYAMDVAGNTLVSYDLVLATADRQIHIWNLTNPTQKFRSLESPLKWQTRDIQCFPTAEAYAVGSVEGRIAIQYVDPAEEKKNYSFKCHRIDIPNGSMLNTPATTGSQNVFAVNTISFHKVQGTFCTGGGDGSLSFWDGYARTKLKSFPAKEINNGDPEARPPVWGTPIVSTSFSHNHDILAYALSYDWSKGHSGVPTNPVTKVMLHPVKPDEVTKKVKK
ncbi:mRNA export factor, partial [Tremellales sp. Uapishka_1]